ncbi:armadillo-type protein [Absidia repens]|uniref:Armadillo-type protein n=1 Tax=Absidia repens TaxID=90262 RepID=A0A1X2IM53_9FUNG|nr:armadillo-type protein [Absidia repens]
MCSWQPATEPLNALLPLLREAMNPSGSYNVQEVFPDYNCYLVYILTQMTQEDQHLRAVAGLTLKNNVRSHYSTIYPAVLDYVKESCLEHIGDADIGKTVGLVISAIMARGRVQGWPEGLQFLVEKLDDPTPTVVELVLNALQRICEDCASDLIYPVNGVQPLCIMLRRFLFYLDHSNDIIRLLALRCVQQFIALRLDSLLTYMNDVLSGIFKLVADENIEIRKTVCQSLISALEFCPKFILPHMPNLVDYMLYSTQSDNEELALEACEFWIVCGEMEIIDNNLEAYLPKVVPVLLKCMVYSETDLLILGGEEDDAHVVDNEQDIKPQFHKSNLVEIDRADKGDLEESGKLKARQHNYGNDNESDDDDDDYDLDDDDDIYNEWTLRKCSATALDIICTYYGETVIVLLMPLLKIELESDDWIHRECGILTLGAVAEGGMQSIAHHLPQLIPFLLTQLNDTKPLVRSITCWTLGRYTNWIAQASQQNPDAFRYYLEPYVNNMLQRILDSNKRVQEAACSSLSLLEEEATTQLIPYLQPILVTLVAAFEKYQHHNLLLLLDTVGTLADVVGEALNDPQYIELIIPPLIGQWQATPDDSPDLFPLLECLSSVTSALGKGFTPFAEPIYVRCVNLVRKTLEKCQLYDQDFNAEEPDKDFMVVALDLLSSIVQALNMDAEPLVAGTNPSLVQLLCLCINDEIAEVRQPSYALLGSLAISCFEHIRAMVPHFIPLIIQRIDYTESVSVCSNAAWAAGEIAIKLGNEIQPYVEPLLQRLLPLIVYKNIKCTENVAITIGRLGLICPTIVAPHLKEFIQPWLESLTTVSDNEEKASAFSGLCEMIKVNPEGAADSLFVVVFPAIANYKSAPPSLKESFYNILAAYRQMLGQLQWDQGVQSVPEEIISALYTSYYI